MPDTTMKQYKWMPVSQLLKSKNPDAKKQRRLFGGEGDENSRTSLGMDEGGGVVNTLQYYKVYSAALY